MLLQNLRSGKNRLLREEIDSKHTYNVPPPSNTRRIYMLTNILDSVQEVASFAPK